jgi:hypothetical protein
MPGPATSSGIRDNHKRVVATMHMTVVSRRTGKKKPSYKLLDLNPLDEAPKTRSSTPGSTTKRKFNFYQE